MPLVILMSKVTKEISPMDIHKPGAQIPNWFDYSCEGRLLSLCARPKLFNAALAFTISPDSMNIVNMVARLFINCVQVGNGYYETYRMHEGYNVHVLDLQSLFSPLT